MPVSKGSTVIGFVGTGVMGRSMARNLMKAGYSLHVYTRTKSKANELIAEGAAWEDTPEKLASASNVIITIVGFPNDVEKVYFGDGDNSGGIIANARAGSYLIDMTTSSPELARKIADAGSARKLHVLDAPVSGGDVGAREARLSIMVGGEKNAFNDLAPVFEAMGKNIVYQGPAGSGQHTKMCNQIAIAAGMLGVCEAIAYARKAGLDPSTVLKSIESGAAGSWSLSNLGPRIIAGNFDPGFYVKHFIKDMRIAAESADRMVLDTPGLDLALSRYEKLADSGGADLGTQSLYKLYEE